MFFVAVWVDVCGKTVNIGHDRGTFQSSFIVL